MWADVVPNIVYASTTPMSAVTVPTGETTAVTFWLDNLMPRKHAAMLVGNAGCGKTAIINGKLRALGDDYISSTTNINYYTNSSLFLKILEAPLEPISAPSSVDDSTPSPAPSLRHKTSAKLHAATC
jgi:dynein heavy chain